MIRPAAEEDIPQIVVLGRKMLPFTPSSAFITLDEQRLSNFIFNAIQLDTWFAYVVEIDATVVGGFIGMVLPHPFDGEALIAAEAEWFIDPQYRNAGFGSELLDTFEQWARAQGAVCMRIGAFDEKTEAFLRHRQLYKIQAVYLKGLD
jgi:RimJ/RimL family protein N-acetyltransferase